MQGCHLEVYTDSFMLCANEPIRSHSLQVVQIYYWSGRLLDLRSVENV